MNAVKWGILLYLGLACQFAVAQRKLPPKSREQQTVEKQAEKRRTRKDRRETEQRWDIHAISRKSKGVSEVSPWHTGTAGVIASDAAEISLFNPSRIGFSPKTELLFRIGEEPFLPNFGLKHNWCAGKKLSLSSEHTLYYPFPGLKILQHTGFKNLIPDSVEIGQGIAMRHEVLFSWLMNPRVFGCPRNGAEKILTLRAGTEFYLGRSQVEPFDYCHTGYHSQVLKNKLLYYGGLQFDSYFSNRFHYSVNALFYNIDFTSDYALEGNLRLTAYVSRRIGLSVAGKVAYKHLGDSTRLALLPLVDFTYLINPGRGNIQYGLFKNKHRRR